jgi:tRNA(fMet)-specific endonuclease VapC
VTHLLDTNACVVNLRLGMGSSVALRLAAAPLGSVGLCSVVVAVLLFGAMRSNNPTLVWNQVATFCGQFSVLPFDLKSAEEYARIRSHLAARGQLIGPNDLLIAATALANGLILVTHNTAEFSRVPGLTLEDWQVP